MALLEKNDEKLVYIGGMNIIESALIYADIDNLMFDIKPQLTIGKSYEQYMFTNSNEEYDYYLIVDDDGCVCLCRPKSAFKPLSEYRNEKINRLLDENN